MNDPIIGEIPDVYEVGYRDGVWVTKEDLFGLEPSPDFDDADNVDTLYFMFTTHTLGPSTGMMVKNLIGVECQLYRNPVLEEWALRLGNYRELGDISGKKDFRRLKRRGVFDHIYDLYGEQNVKFLSLVVDFDTLAIKIMRFMTSVFDLPNVDEDAAEVVRYFRPMDIPAEAKAWHSGSYWLGAEAWEIDMGLDGLDDARFEHELSRAEPTGIVFVSNNIMVGNPEEMGVFTMVYGEIDQYLSGGSYSLNDLDAFPMEGDFRFLGFIGPSPRIPSTEAIEAFLSSNQLVFDYYARDVSDFYYVGKMPTFSDLKGPIEEAIVWGSSDQSPFPRIRLGY